MGFGEIKTGRQECDTLVASLKGCWREGRRHTLDKCSRTLDCAPIIYVFVLLLLLLLFLRESYWTDFFSLNEMWAQVCCNQVNEEIQLVWQIITVCTNASGMKRLGWTLLQSSAVP